MNWRRMLFIALLALLLGALPVLAQGITIDGNFSDWAGKASLVDPGGQMTKRPLHVPILLNSALTPIATACTC